MISLIRFINTQIIKEEEAKELKLHYKHVNKIGIKDDKLYRISEYEYYSDELEDKEIDGTTEKVLKGTNKKVQSWSIYERPSKDILQERWVELSSDDHLVNLLEFAPKCKYPYRIIRTVAGESANINNQLLNDKLAKIEDKLLKFADALDHATDNTYNETCYVHTGGGLLVSLNETTLCEDCCTDNLQRHLNEGWRVIACCVQPNQRRPDYILGRYNPTFQSGNNEGAKRG